MRRAHGKVHVLGPRDGLLLSLHTVVRLGFAALRFDTNFDSVLKAAFWAAIFKLMLGRLHEDYAVQVAIWVPIEREA